MIYIHFILLYFYIQHEQFLCFKHTGRVRSHFSLLGDGFTRMFLRKL